MPRIAIKRVYEPKSEGDGFRVLVDRVWPRGLSEDDAALDAWARAIAPSNELRKWFNHEPDKWPEFRKRYLKELEGRVPELRELNERCGAGPMTLLFSARDVEHNQAVVLREVLEDL